MRQPGGQDTRCCGANVVRASHVLVRKGLGIEQAVRKPRAVVAGLPDATHVDEIPVAGPNLKHPEAVRHYGRNVRVTDKTYCGIEVFELLLRDLVRVQA